MDRRILIIKKQMLLNLKQQLTVEELAVKVNISCSHLHKLFKIEMGMSPFQYLQNVRIEAARKFLEIGFKRVKEIGFEVGIPDQSNFVRDFKKIYGLTPVEYRKQHWAKLEVEETIDTK